MTATATPSQTLTATRTATPTPTPMAPPAIDLSHSAGRPGGIVCVAATLSAHGHSVAALRNDIAYDPDVLSWASCTLNPTAAASGKQLTATPVASNLQRVDVSGEPSSALADSPAYACRLILSPTAPLGAHVLGNTGTALGSGGEPIAGSSGANGSVVATTCNSDCNGNGTATIGELALCINAYLGHPLCDAVAPAQSCPVADADNDGVVNLAEVAACASRFTTGC